MQKLLLLFAFIAIPVLGINAQPATNYNVQQYTTDNGLPSNGIKGLQWDEGTGFLWIATEAGICRYNGLEFTSFTRENTPGMVVERMYYMTKNEKGVIHAVDASGVVFHIRAGSLLKKTIPGLGKLGDNRKRYLLSSYNEAFQQKIFYSPLLDNAVEWRNTMQLADSSMIIRNARGNYYYVSANKPNVDSVPAPESKFEFVLDHRLFVLHKDLRFYTTRDFFKTLEPVSIVGPGISPQSLNSPDLVLYWESGMNNPILISGNNAWRLHYNNGLIEARLVCNAIPPYSFIRYVQYSEKNKTLFLGTDSKGIIVISENRIIPLKLKESDIQERNAYYSQVELSNGNVLTNEAHTIGNFSGAATLPIKGKFDFSVFNFEDSLLWYAQYEGTAKTNILHCYNYKTGNSVLYDKIPMMQNFAMTHSGQRFYIGTWKGFGYLDHDSIHYLFRNDPKIGYQGAPYSIEQITPNTFASASCRGLIFYHTDTGAIDTVLNFPGFCIRTLWKYKDYLFIGTYGKGFYAWKNGKVKAMPLDKNKFLLYTHCFIPDAEGFCWISTNRGLFKTQISDLIDAWENDRTQVYYHYFGKNDGMDMTEMNGGCAPCALVMKNKNISFPTMDGLLWVNPLTARPLLPEGNIFIDEFVAGGQKINPDSINSYKLPSSDRDILVKLGFSSWCNKENIYLDYQLNSSEKWIPVDVNNGALIHLSGLAPGSYKLLIRKLNGFGVNNYSFKEIVFTINTPWTRRWWFYTLCGMVVFGVVTLYLQFRTRQYKIRQRKLEEQVAAKTKELKEQNEILEKNNTIKTRLISIISHDIVTPLKFVTVAGKNLIEKRNLMSEELQQETILEMTNTSQELQLLSTNILNWIKYQNENRRMVKENFNLPELVEQVFGVLNSLAKQKKLTLVNKIDPGLEIYQFFEPLKILIYNLLTNAINFSERGNIIVANKPANNTIIILVKDEGVGMTPEQIQNIMADQFIISSANIDKRKGNGLGYLIIKDLVKMMGASLEIKSEKGWGTEVLIHIPVNNKGKKEW